MSAPTMSPDLIAFLKAWYEWANSGAPEDDPFSRSLGLCDNGDIYARECGFDEDALYLEMVTMFDTEFGRKLYPFGYQEWNDFKSAFALHECPKRLAWVRERLVEAGDL